MGQFHQGKNTLSPCTSRFPILCCSIIFKAFHLIATLWLHKVKVVKNKEDPKILADIV